MAAQLDRARKGGVIAQSHLVTRADYLTGPCLCDSRAVRGVKGFTTTPRRADVQYNLLRSLVAEIQLRISSPRWSDSKILLARFPYFS